MDQSRGFIVGTSAWRMLSRTIVFHISPFRHSSRTFSDALMSYRFISFHPIPCVCCSNCCSRLRPQRHTLWNSKRIYNKGISLACQAGDFQLHSVFLRNHSLLRSYPYGNITAHDNLRPLHILDLHIFQKCRIFVTKSLFIIYRGIQLFVYSRFPLQWSYPR